MKKYNLRVFRIYLTIIFILLINCALQSQWIQQYTNSEALFYTIIFSDKNTGYAAGESLFNYYSFFCKTTNSGVNWDRLILNLYFDTYIYDIDFIDNNTGFICGHTNFIYKTTNGGTNWVYSIAPSIGTQTYNCIQFLNEQTGYLAGRYGMISKTTDGGLNWIALDTTYTGFASMHFKNIDTGFLGNTYGGIYKTTDGGNNWEYRFVTDTLGGIYVINEIKFANNSTGYAVGGNVQNGAIFKTTNNGVDWINNSILPNNPLYSLCVINDKILFCGGDLKIILKSTDGGLTWSNQQIISNLLNIHSIFFLNQDTGFCVNSNYIHKTSNGGSVFINNNNQIYPDKFELYQNYPNPFNPVTKIKFGTPESDFVELEIYDILGKLVQVLVNKKLSAGVYEFEWNGSVHSSGIYFYKFRAGDYVQTRKMVLLR
ncbi:MAG: T9SS type A sorting domain-containing protein [Ignavibacteria bacterium]|nr:T9SS type A sorting domain-containing protein [Ignavibacteria bacterium]